MEERNLRKTRVGKVVSDKMDKTIVVAVQDNVKHPLTEKSLKRHTNSKLMMKITSAELETV